MNPVDTGWIAGAGIELDRNARFSIEVRYQRGIRDLFPETPERVTQQSISFLLGISYGRVNGSRSVPDYGQESGLYLGGNSSPSESSRRVTGILLRAENEISLINLQFFRIERSRQDKQYGYLVTYYIAGKAHSEASRLSLAWSTPAI